MTYRAVVDHLRLLLAGDRKEWRNLPYRLSMKCRGVNLTWVSVRDMGLDESRSHWHSNSGGPDLDFVLNALRICSSDEVLDFGCGKGGAMLTLARHPFARVDGVEACSTLANIAERNLTRLGIRNAAVYCCDAAEFTDLDRYTFLYMYNPFPEVVMLRVLDNILRSVERRTRRLTLIYKNPICHTAVVDHGFCKIRDFEHDFPPFTVYGFGESGAGCEKRTSDA